MQGLKRVCERQWTPSPVDPTWERAGLYNDKRPRNPNQGNYTTAVRRRGRSSITVKPFPFEWELFLVSGDVKIDGENLSPGDHLVVAAGQSLAVETEEGCEYLVIAR